MNVKYPKGDQDGRPFLFLFIGVRYRWILFWNFASRKFLITL